MHPEVARLLGHRPQQPAERVADIGAVRCRPARRDQKKTHQAQGMVDPDRAGMAHRRPQGRAHGVRVGGLEHERRGRDDVPVLAQRPQRIGRGTDAGTGDQRIGVGPGIGAVRHHAHGEIAVETDAHAGRPSAPVGRRELTIGEPLQEGAHGHALCPLLREALDGRIVRRPPPGRPVAEGHGSVGVARRRLGKRLEAAEPLQVPTGRVAPLPERVAERGLFAAAQMQLAEAIPQLLERHGLGRRDDRPVDLASLAQPVDAALLDGGQAEITCGDIDGNQKLVEPAAARWRVGAAALGRLGEQRVKRAQAEEIRASGGKPLRQQRHILEVADAGVARGAQAVDLTGHAPATVESELARSNAAQRRRLVMRKRLEPGDRDVGGFAIEPHGRQQRALRLWRRLVPDPGDVLVAGLDAGERGEPVEWIAHRLGTRKTATPQGGMTLAPPFAVAEDRRLTLIHNPLGQRTTRCSDGIADILGVIAGALRREGDVRGIVPVRTTAHRKVRRRRLQSLERVHGVGVVLGRETEGRRDAKLPRTAPSVP